MEGPDCLKLDDSVDGSAQGFRTKQLKARRSEEDVVGMDIAVVLVVVLLLNHHHALA